MIFLSYLSFLELRCHVLEALKNQGRFDMFQHSLRPRNSNVSFLPPGASPHVVRSIAIVFRDKCIICDGSGKEKKSNVVWIFCTCSQFTAERTTFWIEVMLLISALFKMQDNLSELFSLNRALPLGWKIVISFANRENSWWTHFGAFDLIEMFLSRNSISVRGESKYSSTKSKNRTKKLETNSISITCTEYNVLFGSCRFSNKKPWS